MTNNQYLSNKFRKAKNILKKLNIPYSNKIDKIISEPMVDALGLCHSYEDGSYIISINEDLVNTEINGKTKKPAIEKAIENTILHELIHTCKDCANHSPLWHSYAKIVSENTDYLIETESTSIESDVVDIMCKNYKYALTCENCGRSFYYNRMCKSVKDYKSYHCSYCNGNLKRTR